MLAEEGRPAGKRRWFFRGVEEGPGGGTAESPPYSVSKLISVQFVDEGLQAFALVEAGEALFFRRGAAELP